MKALTSRSEARAEPMFKALVQEGRWNALKIQRSPREFTKAFAFLSRDRRTDDGGGGGSGCRVAASKWAALCVSRLSASEAAGLVFRDAAQTVCDRTPGDAWFLTVRTIVSRVV
ncbi:hypothetical protein Rcae01_06442 [Novipirellula caenicola]|uniref:Uncharacterized protein n=1 Tax=Novipirellula caenicola TaxID=1536901 RepID=A0ABP9W0L9_9BACT